MALTEHDARFAGPEVETLPVYVADTGLPTERDWAAMIPVHLRATLVEGEFAYLGAPIKDGVVVVHRTYLDAELGTNDRRRAWREAAAARDNGPIIVVISGADRTPNQAGPRLYHRGLRVTPERIAPDANFAARFAQFHRAARDALAAGMAIPFELLDRSVGAPAVAALLGGGSSIYQALEGHAQADFAGLYDYGQLDHFQVLWSWLDPHAPVPSGDVFIVLEAPAPLEDKHQRGLEAHLTVYDWIVALANRAASAAGFRPGFRLYVLDALPQGHPNARAFGPKSAVLVAHLVPWVKLSKISDSEHPTAADEDVVRDFKTTFLRACSGSSPSGPTVFADWAADSTHKSDAETLRRLWVSDLTRAEERHDVANAIGPTLLARSLSSRGWLDPVAASLATPADTSDPVIYFLRLLEALGMLDLTPIHSPEWRGGLGGLRAEPFVAADLFSRFGDLRFMLVDDQCNVGFHDVLASFLLRESRREELPALASAPDRFSRASGGSLASFATPKVLLDWLQGTMTLARRDVDEGLAPRLFGKERGFAGESADSGDLTPFDILFLDLRLFSDAEKENTWIEQLVGFAVDYGPQFLRSASVDQRAAFEAVVQAANEQFRRPAGGVRHLALAPLLISLCDPTAPIILFSSTRQRAVIELLRPFPNIITDFAKPALTGYSDEDRAGICEAADVLRSAVERALRMHERRLVWEMFAGWHAHDFWAPPCVMRTAHEQRRQMRQDNREERLDQVNRTHTPRTIAAYAGAPFPPAGEQGWDPVTAPISRFQFSGLVQAIARFCVGETLLDLAPQLAEFTEAAMREATKSGAEWDDAVDPTARYEPDRLDNSCGPLPATDASRARAARAVQRARNRVVHGYLFGEDGLSGLPQVIEELLILFLLSVAAPERADKIQDFVSNPASSAGRFLSAILYGDPHDPRRPENPVRPYAADDDFSRTVFDAASQLWTELRGYGARMDPVDQFIAQYEPGRRLQVTLTEKLNRHPAHAWVDAGNGQSGHLFAADVPGGSNGAVWQDLQRNQTVTVWIKTIDTITREIEFTMTEPSRQNRRQVRPTTARWPVR